MRYKCFVLAVALLGGTFISQADAAGSSERSFLGEMGKKLASAGSVVASTLAKPSTNTMVTTAGVATAATTAGLGLHKRHENQELEEKIDKGKVKVKEIEEWIRQVERETIEAERRIKDSKAEIQSRMSSQSSSHSSNNGNGHKAQNTGTGGNEYNRNQGTTAYEQGASNTNSPNSYSNENRGMFGSPPPNDQTAPWMQNEPISQDRYNTGMGTTKKHKNHKRHKTEIKDFSSSDMGSDGRLLSSDEKRQRKAQRRHYDDGRPRWQ